ncbi:hypothetical protein GPECTOR_62g887 [Gonium pectorale]|uniref:Guanylate cyclase domain-containing protein n=1 Tax=Gonium pectorale TaxID=33097 RepID=A0A150G4I4_GONPE|nr:hypothetical protein GPECTOR_62g887 [Gonium pectorale]|eukprot:KXZ44772.1 hypothetical protein GPECTOR_62g887 [Gonium pectorale]
MHLPDGDEALESVWLQVNIKIKRHGSAPTASAGAHPGSRDAGGCMLLLNATDVTSWVESQERMEGLLQEEHKLLEAMFPRHVIEHVVRNAASRSASHADSLTRGSLVSALPDNTYIAVNARTLRCCSSLAAATTAGAAAVAASKRSSQSTSGALQRPASACGAADDDGGNGGDVGGAEPLLPPLPSWPLRSARAATGAAISTVRGGVSSAAVPRVGAISVPSTITNAAGRVRLREAGAELYARMLGRIGSATGSAGAAPLPLATAHRHVTVLFADIVGFTTMCNELEPLQVMAFLNGLFTRFDSLCDIYGVYKVETIGDCFMVVGGLITVDEDGFKAVRQDGSEDELHAVKVMSFAKAMQREVHGITMPHNGEPLRLRVGLHSGPVTSGIVGSKMPRFCLFGDTVNTASRMESTCDPGAIHASAATAALLPDEAWAPTGGVQVKGKGEMQLAQHPIRKVS